eukprot:1372470-Rhodomonas_salina.1
MLRDLPLPLILALPLLPFALLQLSPDLITDSLVPFLPTRQGSIGLDTTRVLCQYRPRGASVPSHSIHARRSSFLDAQGNFGRTDVPSQRIYAARRGPRTFSGSCTRPATANLGSNALLNILRRQHPLLLRVLLDAHCPLHLHVLPQLPDIPRIPPPRQPDQLLEPSSEHREPRLLHPQVLSHCERPDKLHAVVRVPVRKLQKLGEPALQPLVRVQHLVDVRVIPSKDDDDALVLRISHGRHECRKSLGPERSLAQLIRLVDEENPTPGLLQLLFHPLLCLPNELARQLQACRLHHALVLDQVHSA